METEDLMSQDVLSVWDVLGDGDGPGGAVDLGEVVGSPWGGLGGVVGHLIEFDPDVAAVAFEGGAAGGAAGGKVVHDWAGVGGAPLVPLNLTVELSVYVQRI